MSLGDEQWRFIHYVIRQASVAAAVQHAKIYANDVNPTQKKALRKKLCVLLHTYATQYRAEITNSRHYRNIEKLAKTLGDEFQDRDVLADDCFRIGIAQKALNLYLKFLWCLDKTPTPPHCPFDGTILGEPKRRKLLEDPDPTPWTRMGDIEEYKRWVRAARKRAEEEHVSSIAEWELGLWQRRGTACVP